jgi:GTP-binding protein HflX
VFNKADLCADIAWLVDRYPGSVAISAVTGEGIDDLLQAISDRLRALTEVTELLIPFDRGDMLAAVHREGQVLVEQPDEAGIRVRARLEPGSIGRLQEFIVG